ncbi:MAG: twin-arginine translocase TatA/TatE family subunit [Thermoanaerobaculia bacterium]|nr:twin-arginine translocase TatA/TatE family subunit [Thermoanaerobaculia bacterium]
MFGSLGFPELLFILVLALLIFGPKRLPEIGRTIGKGLAEFRRASNDLKRSIDTEILAADSAERRPAPPSPRATAEPEPAPGDSPATSTPRGRPLRRRPGRRRSGRPGARTSRRPEARPPRRWPLPSNLACRADRCRSCRG